MEYSTFQEKYGKYFAHKRGGIYGITVPHSLVHVVDPKKFAQGKGYHQCALKKGDPIIKIGEGGLRKEESSLMNRIASYKTALPNGFVVNWIAIRPRTTKNLDEAEAKGELTDKGLIEELKKEQLHYCLEWFHSPAAVKRVAIEYHEKHFPNSSFFVFSHTDCTRIMPKPRKWLDDIIHEHDDQAKKEIKCAWDKTCTMTLRG